MAQASGAQISGGALTRIIEPMGIKPEEFRVALQRLRKDVWIESDRVGRVSRHVLTVSGRAQSAAVTPRKYVRGPTPVDRWHLIIAEDGSGTQMLGDVMLSVDYTPIGRNVALGSARSRIRLTVYWDWKYPHRRPPNGFRIVCVRKWCAPPVRRFRTPMNEPHNPAPRDGCQSRFKALRSAHCSYIDGGAWCCVNRTCLRPSTRPTGLARPAVTAYQAYGPKAFSPRHWSQ